MHEKTADSIKTKRLLCIVGGMDAGGAETFLMKIYRTLDRKKYQMDFYVTKKGKGFYDNEIRKLGGRIFHSTPKSKGPIKSFLQLKKTVKHEKYEYVLRLSQHSLSTLDLVAAKLGGAKILAFRSSNSNTGGGWINQWMHRIFKCLAVRIPNVKIAPSVQAAEFMFGKDCVKKEKAFIVNNGIDFSEFRFDHLKREKIRNEFKFKSTSLIVGHIGRFNIQKNHKFLIQIFAEINKIIKNSKLMLVGKGELEREIHDLVYQMKLNGKVFFTGIRSDVPSILMAMDLMIFPSLYEGLPNVVIEAQATGLPCLISCSIDPDVKISEIVRFMSLKKTPAEWAEEAIIHSKQITKRGRIFLSDDYNIGSITEEFTKLIFHHDKGEIY